MQALELGEREMRRAEADCRQRRSVRDGGKAAGGLAQIVGRQDNCLVRRLALKSVLERRRLGRQPDGVEHRDRAG